MPLSTVQTYKIAVVAATGLSRDTLHVYVGLAVFLGAAYAFRKPLRSIAPWLAALAIAALGELVDMRDELRDLDYWRWWASLHDIVNTLCWPTVLWLLARYTRLFDIAPPRKT